MHMVETCRIKNPTIRQWFCNTPCILDIAKKRQLDWIGKVARMEETKIQQQLLMSWTSQGRVTLGSQTPADITEIYLRAGHSQTHTPLRPYPRSRNNMDGTSKKRSNLGKTHQHMGESNAIPRSKKQHKT
jgi:hypothetical protein